MVFQYHYFHTPPHTAYNLLKNCVSPLLGVDGMWHGASSSSLACNVYCGSRTTPAASLYRHIEQLIIVGTNTSASRVNYHLRY